MPHSGTIAAVPQAQPQEQCAPLHIVTPEVVRRNNEPVVRFSCSAACSPACWGLPLQMRKQTACSDEPSSVVLPVPARALCQSAIIAAT